MLLNLVKVSTSTTGTGTMTLGAAITPYLTMAQAGAVNGTTYSYGIEDGSNTEVGTGVYNSAAGTLTRSVINSTNSNAAISLSGAAKVMITTLAHDITTTYRGSSPPANPQEGTRWLDTTTGNEFVYFNDGSSSQWVQFGSTGTQYTPLFIQPTAPTTSGAYMWIQTQYGDDDGVTIWFDDGEG